MKKLTVLLITYNHRKTIEKALNSILKQVAPFDFVIHVLDDASNDGTSDIIKRCARKYPEKIIPFIREYNVGVVKNVFDGIKNIKTPYYATLEGDDYWCDNNKLHMQVNILDDNPSYSFCGHNTLYRNYDDFEHKLNDNPIFSLSIKSREYIFPKKFKRSTFIKVHPSSRVYRTSCLDFKNLKSKDCLVWDSTSYWYFLSKGKMYYINKIMSVYNYTGNGLFSGSSNERQMQMAVRNIFIINREFNYKYHQIFIELLKPYVLIKKIHSRFKIFLLKYCTPKRFLERMYINILKQFQIYAIFASDGYNNLGDVLSYYLLDKLGVLYVKTTPYNANLCMIGSILDLCFFKNRCNNKSLKIFIKNTVSRILHFFLKRDLHIWGSGFISEYEQIKHEKLERFVNPIKIHALRGRISKSRCEKVLSNNLDDVTLGDPGLLSNILINFTKEDKKYDVGIVPHFVDKDNKYLSNIDLKSKTKVIIDITADAIEILKKVAQCKVILSSALHGLIVADSFNIPNQWVVFSDNVIGDGYKFKDYYSVFNIDNPKLIDLRKEKIGDKDIDYIIKNYIIAKKHVDNICANLLKTFPGNEKNVK